jgi:hypothetical protein
MTEITIVNQSTALTDAEVQAVIPAITTFANRDVCPAWGLDPVAIMFAGTGSVIDPAAWPIYIMDTADISGALGYHLDTAGRVSGKVFAGDCLRDGVSWTVDLTHELCEMMIDPTCDTLITLSDGRQTVREGADPVEDDSCGYGISGVLVSDFALPAYFTGALGPWDFQKKLTSWVPTLASGGYISLLSPGATQWTQVFAMRADGSISDRAKRMGRLAWRIAHP